MQIMIKGGRLARACLGLAAMLALGACSTKPVPETFANLDTYAIAQHVRCEVRDALKRLDGLSNPWVKPYKTTGSVPSTVQPCCNQAPPPPAMVPILVHPVRNSAIIYEFTFDIEENNDLTGSVDFFDLMTGGIFSLGVTAENKRQRKNFRNFRIQESAGQLIEDAGLAEECRQIESGVGVFYPITGKIGLEESLRTYLRLLGTKKLTGPAGGGVPTFADTLEFTTTVGGSINPSISLSGPRSNISLRQTGVGIGMLRTDVHRLKIVLSISEASIAAATRATMQQDAARGVANDGGILTRPEVTAEHEQILLRELERQSDERLRSDGNVFLR